MSDFDHSTQHFFVDQKVSITKYITGPISGCVIIVATESTIGGWFYLVEDRAGERRWLQGDQLEAEGGAS